MSVCVYCSCYVVNDVSVIHKEKKQCKLCNHTNFEIYSLVLESDWVFSVYLPANFDNLDTDIRSVVKISRRRVRQLDFSDYRSYITLDPNHEQI